MIQETFSNRLKSARQLRGLSLRGLSSKLDNKISRQTIHQYENGVSKPSQETLLLLCEVLELPLAYFNKSIIEFKEIEFRDLENIPAKERQRIEVTAEEFLERYLELENLLGTDTKLEKPFSGIVIRTFEDVEKVAIDLRKKWQLGESPILNVVKLLEEKGIKVCEVDALADFSGTVAKAAEGVYVMILNKNEGVPIDRKRLTVLSELAHVLLLFDSKIQQKEKKNYCHYFARTMLFPKSKAEAEFGSFRKHIPLNELLIGKEEYGISIKDLLQRLRDLNIITEHHYTLQRKLINEKKWKIVEPGKFYGREQPVRMKQLIFRGIAEGIISNTKAAELYGKTLSELNRLLALS